jgi:endonuclease/exonuclease/phosphatase (EEP) superfamily protein YafD
MMSKLFFRFGWFTWLIVLLTKLIWILVYYDFFPADSKWLALGYLPPIWFIIFLAIPLLFFGLARQRRLWVPVTGIYLVFLLVFGDFSFKRSGYQYDLQDGTAPTVSVIALNVRYYSYGVDRISEFIRSSGADIYLLNENVLNEEQRQIFEKAIYPLHFYLGRPEETAIVSRYPIVAVKEVELPSHQASLHDYNLIETQPLNPQRSFIHAVIAVNDRNLHAVSLRFIAGRAKDRSFREILRWGFYLLETQRTELEFFMQYLDRLEGPVIFGGDLNATPSSFVIRTLSKNATDAYLHDHIWGGFTFPTEIMPIARLDYLFCRHEAFPIRSTRLPQIVSDHYPVLAEFKITGSAPL